MQVLDNWQVILMSMYLLLCDVEGHETGFGFPVGSSSFQSCLWLIIHFIVVWNLSSCKFSLKKVWLKRISARPHINNVHKRFCLLFFGACITVIICYIKCIHHQQLLIIVFMDVTRLLQTNCTKFKAIYRTAYLEDNQAYWLHAHNKLF